MTRNMKDHQATKGCGEASTLVRGEEAEGELKRKEYEHRLRQLHVKLVALQEWVRHEGRKICIVFEGRDGAGKGGAIKAITARVSPRVFRVVALPAPTEREQSQMYIQRYLPHLPSGGEVVIFDRSWYNRAGVEYVMGFVSDEQHKRFLEVCPEIEKIVVSTGIILIKLWLEVGQDEQDKRFKARIDDPLRQWKLSPMDLPSRERWYDYSRARDAMLDATDTELAPWHVVRSDDKRRARLGIISHLLSQFDYAPIKRPKIKLPGRSKKRAYDDEATMTGRRWIAQKY
jgi:polyphosphate kinase 2